jgi:hypothetical protein
MGQRLTQALHGHDVVSSGEGAQTGGCCLQAWRRSSAFALRPPIDRPEVPSASSGQEIVQDPKRVTVAGEPGDGWSSDLPPAESRLGGSRPTESK